MRFPTKALWLASLLSLSFVLPAQTEDEEIPSDEEEAEVEVKEHEIDLDWDPSIKMGDLTRGMPPLPSTKVTIHRFRDIRPRRELVADMKEAREKDDDKKKRPVKVHVFITEDSVSEWVTKNFSRSLGKAGVRIGSSGDVVIRGEITHFLATKSPDYNGDVAIRINVERDGKVLWRGTVSGWAHEPNGRGIGREGDYGEVLSDAIVRAAASLAWYPKFRAALQGNVVDTPVPGQPVDPDSEQE